MQSKSQDLVKYSEGRRKLGKSFTERETPSTLYSFSIFLVHVDTYKLRYSHTFSYSHTISWLCTLRILQSMNLLKLEYLGDTRSYVNPLYHTTPFLALSVVHITRQNQPLALCIHAKTLFNTSRLSFSCKKQPEVSSLWCLSIHEIDFKFNHPMKSRPTKKLNALAAIGSRAERDEGRVNTN